ncbi:MAG: hypothetical protein AAF577_14460 [Pseudomonadota bacterium]
MTSLAAAEGQPLSPPRGLVGALGGLARRAVAVILALHPLGAVLVLGWLMRLMAAEAAISRHRLVHDIGLSRAPLPGWVVAGQIDAPAHGRGWLARSLGALWLNLAAGLAALGTLVAGTLPFTALWLMSWWGGWENSFNKGYEQSWVGPTLGLLSVAVALPLLARLPMALAHQAVEGRMSAFFARRAVTRLIRAAGWRYVALGLATALATAPLFAAQALPTFVEGWSPGFAERHAESLDRFIAVCRLVATTWLVLSLIAVRRWAARLHARATLRLEAGPLPSGPVALTGTLLRTLLLWAASFAVVAQVFVAQFVNHQWVVWLIPPFAGLPFFAPLTGLP